MFKLMIIFNMVISSINTIAPNAERNTGLEQIKNSIDFKLLSPHYSMQSWKLEIKEPYPIVLKRPITKVRLHYFDKSGQTYMFGIEQHKSIGYKRKQERIHINVRNNTSTRIIVQEDFKFDKSGEFLTFDKIEARFTPWADDTPGGFLRWIQNGTYIEIDSPQLTKKDMILLAKSMK